MAVIPIHGVTKTTMNKKVEEKILKVVGISRIGKYHMTKLKGKWLVVISKTCKL